MVLERYTAQSQKLRVRKHREGSIPSHATFHAQTKTLKEGFSLERKSCIRGWFTDH